MAISTDKSPLLPQVLPDDMHVLSHLPLVVVAFNCFCVWLKGALANDHPDVHLN